MNHSITNFDMQQKNRQKDKRYKSVSLMALMGEKITHSWSTAAGITKKKKKGEI